MSWLRLMPPGAPVVATPTRVATIGAAVRPASRGMSDEQVQDFTDLLMEWLKAKGERSLQKAREKAIADRAKRPPDPAVERQREADDIRDAYESLGWRLRGQPYDLASFAAELVPVIASVHPRRETGFALGLSGEGRAVEFLLLGIGSSRGCSWSELDVERLWRRPDVASLVIGHTHPSTSGCVAGDAGSARPSQQDWAFHRRVQKTSREVGKPFENVIVSASGEFYSFSSRTRDLVSEDVMQEAAIAAARNPRRRKR